MLAERLNQPNHIFAVNNIDVRGGREGSQALFFGAHDA